MHYSVKVAFALLLAATAALPAAVTHPAATVSGQPEAEALPDAESLFEAHIEAIGGRDALDKHTDRTMHAVYRVLATGDVQILTIYTEAPGSLRAELEAPALGATIRSTDGQSVWGTNISGAPFELIDRARDEMIDGAAFQGEADYKAHYASIKTIGTATISDKPAHRVDFVTRSGLTGAVYFDIETHRVSARQLFPADTSQPSTLVAVSNYKDFDGVLIPTLQRQMGGDALTPAVEIEFKWVEINTGDMPEFGPPSNMARVNEPDNG